MEIAVKVCYIIKEFPRRSAGGAENVRARGIQSPGEDTLEGGGSPEQKRGAIGRGKPRQGVAPSELNKNID